MSVARGKDYVEVVYSREHWILLERLRSKARKLLECLAMQGVYGIVHGSIARGDVHPGSDIDVFVPYPVNYLLVIESLERCNEKIYRITVVQATPSYVPKVYLEIDPYGQGIVSFPLGDLSRGEREFYKWGGELVLADLRRGTRVPGVNKDLLLIIPTEEGHREIPVKGNEYLAARMTGVSLETVQERVNILSARREKGSTGLFLKEVLPGDADISSVIDEIKRRNPFFRKRVE